MRAKDHIDPASVELRIAIFTGAVNDVPSQSPEETWAEHSGDKHGHKVLPAS